jgi:sulfur carrier protein
VKITVNGESREIQDRTTVRGLIELLDLGAGPVAVERNGEIVPRADHASTALAEADVVEIVHFVGGG